jgi:Tol biopolymer transport system component
LWSPDSLSVVQSIPSKPTYPDGWLVNIINLKQASVVTIRTRAFALGWSPDGKNLIVADASTLSDGKAQSWAVSPTSTGSPPITLPGQLTEFLGFVKTA